MALYGPMMIDIEGLTLTDEDIGLIREPMVGGLILFSRNIASADQVLQLTQSIKQIKPNILIAVDQEGGRVQRLKGEFTSIPAMATIGELYSSEPKRALTYAEDLAELIALEVQSVGIDISFTPVLDLGWQGSEIIGDRAFSTRSEEIVIIGEAFIKGLNKGGMSATGKHFPGHGSIVADSHIDIPIDKRCFSEIESNDLVPFKQLSKILGGMMPAHIIYNNVDPNAAGFSPFWLQQVLRDNCGFDGVIFSDDLSMKGAEIAGNFEQRAEQALTAGCDMILVCNDRVAAKQVLKHIACNSLDESSSARIERLVTKKQAHGLEQLKNNQRWLTLKQKLDL